ncbi:MAG: hypothetical protein O7G13_06405 [Alphaproteobacteria bacterium]|nr:hypothetical protein [Alphaproteobacteria bacterium]
MFFSENALQQLEEERQLVSAKCDELWISYLRRSFIEPRAKEHAQQGFLRRLKTLVRCIENTFEILPPDRVELPSIEERADVIINLQAFIFNVFGGVDNLAWIWVYEKDVTKEDGSPIPSGWVGLREKNTLVRKSFSPEFRAHLDGFDEWLSYLENFRHAVAHRIPLYVPPYVVTDDKRVAYQDLENRKTDALDRNDFESYDRFSVEQEELAVFSPVMTHSFEEGARTVVFHSQMLADFHTIEDLGWKLLEELDR